MLAITILRERTGHWTRMLRSLARFSRSDASCRTPWLAGCITNMSGFRFSARTGRDLERGRRGYRATALHLCRPRRPDWRRERIVGRALPRAACETLIQFSKGPCPSMKSLRWPLITRAGIWREVLEFVRLPLPLLRVRRGRFFDRNIWPDSCVFRIKRQPFLKPGFAISLPLSLRGGEACPGAEAERASRKIACAVPRSFHRQAASRAQRCRHPM